MEAAPATVHLSLDVTRLRDKPALPALRHPGSRLLRNHGVFTGKPRPSLGSVLTLVARRGNLWDHPHGKVFRPGGCLRRGGKGPSRASPSGPSPVQPGRVWGPLGGPAWPARTHVGADGRFAVLPYIYPGEWGPSSPWGVGPSSPLR